MQNTYNAEEFASRGYFVIGIDHTGDAMMTLFPDHSVVIGKYIRRGTPFWFKSAAEASEMLDLRTRDVRAVMDQLPQLGLGAALDLGKVGVFGHSFGGATTGSVCAIDSRCRAAAVLDGNIDTGHVPSDTHVPVLLIHGESFLSGPFSIAARATRFSDRDRLDQANFGHDAYAIRVRGTAHGNFTDLPLLTRLHRLSLLTGEMDGQRSVELVSALLLNFFDHYLMNQPNRMAEISSRYPEAEYRERPRTTEK